MNNFECVIDEFFLRIDEKTGLEKELDNFSLLYFLRDKENVMRLSQDLERLGHNSFEILSNGSSAIALRSENGSIIRLDCLGSDEELRQKSPFMLQADQTLAYDFEGEIGYAEILPYAPSLYSLWKSKQLPREDILAIHYRFRAELARHGLIGSDLIAIGGGPRLDNMGLLNGLPVMIDPGSILFSSKKIPDDDPIFGRELSYRLERKYALPHITAQKWEWPGEVVGWRSILSEAFGKALQATGLNSFISRSRLQKDSARHWEPD